MSTYIAFLVLVALSCFLAGWAYVATRDYKSAADRLSRLQFTNPYAPLLGRVVYAKVYEGSEWERMLVVAVSWKGAVAVRPLRDLSTKARWIHKQHVPTRVRSTEP